ncbi:type VI secretion system contractile sheath large subunit [Candidatus Sneabacter namystus]|uniref:Type VI secretion system contractile sheath large subunit n=1 Tax=Candidatus Sneabacter namystus TaxID=2601646 RepID=A0A5C0UKF3_9RICK|nr:type VI secretion system contractile sheath large subunit [Candidatus Sneabacter namystus]QEK39912.1 type VI secretion system contractile sheath large subunit [Candidatus Sneabacter namystus]
MSTEGQKEESQSAETASEQVSILDEVLEATSADSDKDYTEGLIKILADEAIKGSVTWEKSIIKTVEFAIAKMDQIVSDQVRTVMHHPDFQKLEGTWRGLHYMVKNTLCSAQLKIKVLNVDKKTLLKDFDKAVEFDQSQLFKKVYEEEYGTAGGAPYSTLVADYEFKNHPQDISLLKYLSEVSAAAFAPCITAADSSVMGMKSWKELGDPTDLERIFDSPLYAQWNNFRKSDESRFITLTMPRTLARVPYGSATCPIEDFSYEEFETRNDGLSLQTDASKYCWMNSAFVYGAVLTRAFSEFGWCTAIRGVENGGKVESLPVHTFLSDDGEIDLSCPTEIGITDRREAELSKLGFLPLCHYKGEDYSVFFGAQTMNKPAQYDDPDATANSEIAARIPYIFATSRIAHYLKVIARDKIGSFMERTDVESWLNKWIFNYVNSNPDSGQALKARYPLADAKVVVEEVPGKPGSYNAVAYLRPWLQLEELTTSLRLVAKIPG